MLIHFFLRYHSVTGQNFYISGNIPSLGNDSKAEAVPMQYLNSDYWHILIDTEDFHFTTAIRYNYILRYEDGVETLEGLQDRTIELPQLKVPQLNVYDTWNYAGEYQNTFYSQPFQQTLLRRNPPKVKLPAARHTTHILKVKWPLLQENETLFIIGNCDALHNWDAQNPVLMQPEGVWFTHRADFTDAAFPVEYKYGIWNVKEKRRVSLESGPNRLLTGNAETPTLLHDGYAWLPNNTFKGAGVAIPVFSLRSKNSFGTGEFSDIMPLVDWAKSTGLKLIQLLPVNDTTNTNTWRDSYPYSAISVFALHPLYINVEKVAGKKHADLVKPYRKKQKGLNDLPHLDYEPVISTKQKVLAELYEVMKEEWMTDPEYASFLDNNRHWLLPYAAFCYLRDENKTSDFTQWKKYSTYQAAEIESMASPKHKLFDKVAIHLFIQYHLHRQLIEAVEYAHKNGIILKGDIAIGVNRHSCDTWVNPELFYMDQQAGAPPDAFAVKGQNWGFPTYNWQRMKDNGYKWWHQRFNQMSYYFDAFRIDHILGFFRIWSIPQTEVEGIMGKFVPCIPVHRNEFDERGIWFNYDRYCKPFITRDLVNALCGNKADWVIETFLENNGWNQYQFKDAFNTQRKIENWFVENIEAESSLKEHLFDLISNVVLFEEKGSNGQQFHFRFSMDTTASFRLLDEHTQWQLKALYNHYFFERQDDFWRHEALQKLPALKMATNMLICGEDLGLVPHSVPGVMKDLGILSLEIQRMPKDPTKTFFHPAEAPYLSVVTPSTHDMSTIRGWWEEDRELTQRFYNVELGHAGPAPYYCEAWVNKQIIEQHFRSPAMWSIFQLQDLLGSDAPLRKNNPQEERINIPSNPKHFWRYRMHLFIEDLKREKAFNQSVRQMVTDSGRA